jgi:hypothetical protein
VRLALYKRSVRRAIYYRGSYKRYIYVDEGLELRKKYCEDKIK